MSRTAVELAMRPARAGTIVNVTLSPHHGLPGMTHSSAARAAVEGYTRALARELAGDGIAVLALAAGHFDAESIRKYPEPVWRAAARTVPLQRLGREQEHAWLVALAASPLGRALSGSVVTLDGARDNWFGPWPPPTLTDETGAVPTESRRPSG
jgi:citronellol/citronellal dehydrogenase